MLKPCVPDPVVEADGVHRTQSPHLLGSAIDDLRRPLLERMGDVDAAYPRELHADSALSSSPGRSD